MEFFVELIDQLSLYQRLFLAAMLLGVSSGLLGAFVVVRRVALVGDCLSHSVFPGIILGFVVCHTLGLGRNSWVVFLSAASIGLLSMWLVRLIQSTTRLKSDTSLGIILASFFGVGLAMKSILRPYMDKYVDLEAFLFGEIATIASEEFLMMIISTSTIAFLVWLLIRPFLVTSFDEGFAISLGYPVKFINFIFYGLLSFSVVVALQSVGVILVSAMLITPAATAYLLTDRIRRLIAYSIGFATIAGLLGCYLCISIPDWSNSRVSPSPGPTIAIVASGIFGLTYLFAPQYGVVAKLYRTKRRRAIVAQENTLKSIYKLLEDRDFEDDLVMLPELESINRRPKKILMREILKLVSNKLARLSKDKSGIYLTEAGGIRAAQLVRNHRLWELYLTKQADYQSDHVHDDAEKIEHVLGENIVRQLEKELGFPTKDPHGKPIPALYGKEEN